MANLTETASWVAGIYRLEITDPVEGGVDGISNVQAKQLADRTAFLKAAVEGAQDALSEKAPTHNPVFTGVVGGVLKEMVGLGNVDDTPDTDKPISTATQTALNAKQATLVSGTNIKTINGVDILGVGNAEITTAAGSIASETVTATAGQTLVALGNAYVPGSNTLRLFVNGLLVSVGTDYTETSATSVTFATGLAAGDEVRADVFGTPSVGSVDAVNVGFTPAGAGAVARDAGAKLRETVSVRDFGAVGDGVADDAAAIQAAHDSLPPDGGAIYFPSGIYAVANRIRITKRNVRFIGENKYNTYIAPTAAVTDAALHVIGFAFELSDTTVYAPPGGGYCIWSRGAGDLYIHDNVLMNGGSNNTGYGIVLEDVNESLTFVPGAYRHRIERNFISTGGSYFNYGVVTGANCTSAGMNACTFSDNHIIASNGISIAYGGGNVLRGNLFQSATGGNSGSRPFTLGSGYGCVFGGELHAVGNYFERFEYDFYQSSSGAVFSVTAHTSDASNEVYAAQSGYPSPTVCETGNGISAEKLDIQVSTLIAANGAVLSTNRRGLRLVSNASSYTGLLLSTVGAKEGQIITLWNNSYPMQFAHGGSIDLSGFGSQLILGQQGVSLNGVTAHGNSASFMFSESGTWRLLNVSMHGPSIGGSVEYSFSANGETLPTNTSYINITGGGASRTGAMLAVGMVYGQMLTITANSWPVSFSSDAAVWASAGAPTLGGAAGECLSVQLVYTVSGWFELSRAVR